MQTGSLARLHGYTAALAQTLTPPPDGLLLVVLSVPVPRPPGPSYLGAPMLSSDLAPNPSAMRSLGGDHISAAAFIIVPPIPRSHTRGITIPPPATTTTLHKHLSLRPPRDTPPQIAQTAQTAQTATPTAQVHLPSHRGPLLIFLSPHSGTSP